MKSIESVEKFFLGIFFASYKLNIVNQNTIKIAIFFFKLIHGFTFESSHKFITKSFGGKIFFCIFTFVPPTIISGNEVTSNGEGGIEIIVGGTNVKIQKNTITKNKASGIAVQFYSFIEKTGSIIIENNTLSKNGHFGLLCGIPSGGKPSGSYWDESIELKTNVIEGNKSGTIEKICNIIAIDEEEEKENTLINKPDTLSEKKEEDENEETKEQIIKEQLDEQAKINDSLISASNQNLENLKKKNSILLFLLGTNKKDLDSLENKTKEIDSELSKIKNMLPEIKNSQNLDLANLLLRSLEDELEKNNQLLEERKGKLSLFGWIPRLFE
jgi:hypothetical protein